MWLLLLPRLLPLLLPHLFLLLFRTRRRFPFLQDLLLGLARGQHLGRVDVHLQKNRRELVVELLAALAELLGLALPLSGGLRTCSSSSISLYFSAFSCILRMACLISSFSWFTVSRMLSSSFLSARTSTAGNGGGLRAASSAAASSPRTARCRFPCRPSLWTRRSAP